MARSRIRLSVLGVAAGALLLTACSSGSNEATIDLPQPAVTPTPSATPKADSEVPWSTPQATADEQQRTAAGYVPGEERYAFPSELVTDGVRIASEPECDPFASYSDEEILQAVKSAIVFIGDVSMNDSLLTPGTPAELAEAAVNDYVTANALDQFRATKDSYEAIKADMHAADNATDAFADWVTDDGEPVEAWGDAMDAAALVKYDMPHFDPTSTDIDKDFRWIVRDLSACSITDTDGLRISVEATRWAPIDGTASDYWWILDKPTREATRLDNMVVLQMVPNQANDASRPWLVDSARSAFTHYSYLNNNCYGVQTAGCESLVDREYVTPMRADSYPWPRSYLP